MQISGKDTNWGEFLHAVAGSANRQTEFGEQFGHRW